MKKFCAIVLALVLGVCGSALADGGLVTAYDAAEQLMYNTGNVTMNGTLNLYWNDTLVKKVQGKLLMDGEDEYQRLDITTPGMWGFSVSNGYSVLAYGDKVYTISREMYGYESDGHSQRTPYETILKKTDYTRELIKLGRLIVSEIDEKIGERVTTEAETGGTVIRAELNAEDLPGETDTVVNLVWQYGVDRYYRADYIKQMEYLPEEPQGYSTATKALVYTTDSFHVTAAKIEVALDAEGRIAGVTGEIAMDQNCRDGNVYPLRAEFTLTAGEYGTSQVQGNEEIDAEMSEVVEIQNQAEDFGGPGLEEGEEDSKGNG